eukprot:PhF_6_TR31170/c0_g1_i1/m.45696
MNFKVRQELIYWIIVVGLIFGIRYITDDGDEPSPTSAPKQQPTTKTLSRRSASRNQQGISPLNCTLKYYVGMASLRLPSLSMETLASKHNDHFAALWTEYELHKLFRETACRVFESEAANFVWMETGFAKITTSEAPTKEEIQSHIRSWTAFLKQFKTPKDVFIYVPNWAWMRGVQIEDLSYPPHTVHVVTHSVGQWLLTPNLCMKHCSRPNYALVKNIKQAIQQCFAEYCGEGTNFIVPQDFHVGVGKHPVSLPHGRYACNDLTPKADRTLFLQMSGSHKEPGTHKLFMSFGKFSSGEQAKWSQDILATYDMCRATFCIETPGSDQSNTGRLSDIILCECIPVLVCDHCIYPFSQALNYSSFSLRFIEKDIPKIVPSLQRMSSEEIVSLREGVKAVKPSFITPTSLCSTNNRSTSYANAIFQQFSLTLSPSATAAGDS